MDSYLALSNFIEHHRLEVDPVGNCRFMGSIGYESPKKSITTSTEVVFIRHSVKDGNVELQEQVEMQAEDYHLDLSAKWQNYEFNSITGKLLVSGSSPKMGGNYVIQITPK